MSTATNQDYDPSGECGFSLETTLGNCSLFTYIGYRTIKVAGSNSNAELIRCLNGKGIATRDNRNGSFQTTLFPATLLFSDLEDDLHEIIGKVDS